MLFEGCFSVHKPTGMSSYDVIRKIKQLLGRVKIGHAGTLDPFASGVLVVAIGRKFTKRLDEFQAMQKQYLFTIQLGKTTSTLDPEGDVEAECDVNTSLTQAHIEQECQVFVGDIQQMPPAFSAKKINGKRAYKLAREGKEVVLEPSKVTIHSLDILAYDSALKQISCRITCSKGTYVRSLSRDIAKALGTVGYTLDLVREAVGKFEVSTAVRLDDLEAYFKQNSTLKPNVIHG